MAEAETQPATKHAVEADTEWSTDITLFLKGLLRVWFLLILAAISAVFTYIVTQQEWNFPWFPPLATAVLVFYAVYRAWGFRTKEQTRRLYMEQYGRAREARSFRCDLCGATFEQPEGADLCPECYEEGIVPVEK